MALMINELFQEGEIKIYDPLKGEEDLQRRILRITSPLSFDKDPLRVLRAIRIAKARDLTIDKKTKEEISRRKDRLPFSAAERIRNEFFKILSFSGVRDSMNLLEDLKLLSILLPETEGIKDQQKQNNLSRWEHSLETVEWCEWALGHLGELFPEFEVNLKSHFGEEIEAGVERQSILKLGSLLHECKKTLQRDSSNIAREIARRFKLGKRAKIILKNLITHHAQVLKLFQQEKINNRVYFRFFQDFSSEGLDIIVLSWADFIASFPERFGGPLDLKLRKLINSLVSYYFKEYLVTSPQPLISGKEIIEYFGLKEGKIIGNLLSLVAEAEAKGLLSSRKEAISYVEKLIKGMEKV
jgi:tRNA nucleotidyltransferase/poly(A) polymerase